MKVKHDLPDRGDTIRLVIGWTAVISALLVIAFDHRTGGILMTIGVCILFPHYYTEIQSQTTERNSALRGRAPRAEEVDLTRQDQATEYRNLFDAGTISSEEYHDVVGRLYPELLRGPSQGNQNAQQGADSNRDGA